LMVSSGEQIWNKFGSPCEGPIFVVVLFEHDHHEKGRLLATNGLHLYGDQKKIL